MTTDSELDDWKRAWASQSSTVDASAWLARAKSTARWELVRTAIGVVVGVVGYAALALSSLPTEWKWLGLAGVVFIGATTGVMLRGRRGTWRPAAQSMRAYVELVERRAKARLRYLSVFRWLAGGWLLLVGVPFFGWVWWSHAFADQLEFFTGVALGFVPLFALSLWELRRLRRASTRELDEASTLLRELTTEGAD